MPPWRDKAEALFPELAVQVQTAENPYPLWFDLLKAFTAAYYESPRNDSLIERIYEYADWCDHQPRGQTAEDDLMTAVAVCFYEDLPKNDATRADMPRWFTRQEILNMKSLLRYTMSEEEFQYLLILFPQTPPHLRRIPEKTPAKRPY